MLEEIIADRGYEGDYTWMCDITERVKNCTITVVHGINRIVKVHQRLEDEQSIR